MIVDTRLKEFASERQVEYIDAVNSEGSFRKASKKLGVGPDRVRISLKSLVKNAQLRGYSPEHDMVHSVPETHLVQGTSTLYDRTGAITQQWVKTKLNDKAFEQVMTEFVQSLVQECKGLSPLIPKPKFTDDDLLAVYPMGDPHFGLYAWQEEAGESFDLNIAERLTNAAIDRLVTSAPTATTALLLDLGDSLHGDNESNQTSHSGHSLDVDTRWSKIMQVALRSKIYCVARLLEKHQKVIVRVVRGNHDGHSSFSLALALDAYYHNNPRVQVELSPSKFWYFKFGKVLLGATHGDTCKMINLPGVMAADKPKDWGDTEYRYWYQGHIHHEDRKEFPGVVVEAFRTLAARDAWHAGQGYRAGRDMRCIVHHKQYGETERHRVDIAELEDGNS